MKIDSFWVVCVGAGTTAVHIDNEEMEQVLRAIKTGAKYVDIETIHGTRGAIMIDKITDWGFSTPDSRRADNIETEELRLERELHWKEVNKESWEQ